jgi:A/G-specific adenine glycosylase
MARPAGGLIAPRLIAWHGRAGRHDLPWQLDRTPFRVWVSEVMLQQTQVATVIPYFQRFMESFPGVRALAAAPADEVLHHWSGLGYYARARNLQRAAQLVVERHDGEFPVDFDSVAALPGIGRSTAGAILALSRDQPHPILDGNVRRVLARHRAVEGRTGERAFEARLWEIAAGETPVEGVAQYTQAIMDLGATVCTRRNPRCADCPIAADCKALAQGRAQDFPAPKKPAARRQRETWMLFAHRDDGSVRLLQRPSSGVWGGLWSPPEFPSRAAAELASQGAGSCREGAPLLHAFTHFDLRIHPLWARHAQAGAVAEEPAVLWYNAARPARVGVPTPVAELLKSPPP